MIGKFFHGLGWLASKFIMIVLAIVVIGPYEGSKWLYKRVYKDSIDWVGFSLFGIVGSIFAADRGFEFVHGLGHGIFASGVASVISFLLAAAFITPILWMVLLRWIVKLGDKLWRGINNFARTHFADTASGLLAVVRELPGSDKLWEPVVDPEKKRFFLDVVGAITYAASVSLSGYVGYLVLEWSKAFAASHILWNGVATATGAVVAGVVFLLLADIVSKWLYYGKRAALGLLLSAAAVIGAAPFVSAFFGLSLVTTVIGGIIAFALVAGYIFPLVTLLFSDHLLEWVRTKLKPLLQSAYEEKETGSRQLFHQLTNFAVTALVGWGAWALCGAIGLPVVVGVVSTAVVLALGYVLFGKALDWEGGNFVLGGSLSVGAGLWAGFSWVGANFIYGNWGAVFAGALAALLVFFLLFPLVYVAYRWLSTRALVTGAVDAAGKALSTAHDKVWKRFDKLVDRCQKIYNYAYRDERPYDKLVLHCTNLLVTAGAAYGLHLLLAGFAVTHGWLALTAVGIGMLITYIAGGHYIIKGGLELVGGAWSLIAAIALGAVVNHAQPLGLAFAVPFGIVVWGINYFLFYPLFFIGVRYIADPLLTSWLLPVLDGIHSWCWRTFSAVFVGVRDFLAPIFKPIWEWIGGFFVGAWKMATDAWNSMFGRK